MVFPMTCRPPGTRTVTVPLNRAAAPWLLSTIAPVPCVRWTLAVVVPRVSSRSLTAIRTTVRGSVPGGAFAPTGRVTCSIAKVPRSVCCRTVTSTGMAEPSTTRTLPPRSGDTPTVTAPGVVLSCSRPETSAIVRPGASRWTVLVKLAATPSLWSSIVPVLMVTVTGRRFPLLGFGSPIAKVTGVAPATPLAVPRLSTRVPSVRLTSEKLPVSDSPATTSVRFEAPR